MSFRNVFDIDVDSLPDSQASQIHADQLTHLEDIYSSPDDSEDPVLVYQARFQGKIVAVKEMSCLEGDMLRRRNESYIHETLTAKEVPNIVKYEGYVLTDETYSIVMEYIPRTLASMIDEGDKSKVTEQQSLKLFSDVTRAVAGMHALQIVHRDIKDTNVLVSSDMTAKLSDFGFAVEMRKPLEVTCGTLGWAAPELFLSYCGGPCFGQTYTEKVDIYSLAVLGWQCMEWKVPENDPKILMSSSVEKYCEFSRCPPKLAGLIGRGWLSDPAQRPSASAFLAELQDPSILSNAQPQSSPWFCP